MYKFDKLHMRTEVELYELQYLLDCSHLKDIVMVEIGSYNGESTEVFASHPSVQLLYAVDPWVNGYDDNDPASSEVDMNLVEGYFDEVAAKYPEKIRKYKMTSEEAVKGVPDESLDLVYIDGNHQYDAVCKDIQMWLPKIKTGGWITGHDYSNYSYRVREAVIATLNKESDYLDLHGNWGVIVCR